MVNWIKNWLLPSIADMLFISVFIYLVLPSNQELLYDADTGYHIRVGEYILNTLTIPRSDIFSFIEPSIPWTAHEWLSEVVMALLHRYCDLTAVVIAFSIMIAASTVLFYKNIKSEGNNVLLAVIASVMFVLLSNVHWLARPHIFSLIILLGWYRLLDDFQYRHNNRLWQLPLILILWVNLHGGFVIGLAMLGIYFAGNFQLLYTNRKKWEDYGKEKSREFGTILGACLIACLANPYSYHILIFPFKLITDKYIMDRVGEFLSPNFHQFQPFKYVLYLIIIVFAYSKRKPNVIEAILLILFTGMSLYSVRYIPLFGVIVIPILLRYIDLELLSRHQDVVNFIKKRIENITTVDHITKGYIWPILCIVITLLFAVNGTLVYQFNSDIKPIAALEFLRKNPIAGNMYNNDEFGDCVIYTYAQQYKVFIDGRGDMYGSERLKEYFRVREFEPGWQDVIEKYKISWMFINTGSVLSRYLILTNDWKLVYSDKVASIFVKNIPLHASLIEKFPDVKLYTQKSDVPSNTL